MLSKRPCRIRRVKCGEEKPACLRCTSTGRTCDGYDKDRSPSRVRVVLDPLEGAELAKSEFLKACQWNEALRYMRPLAPDIDGSKVSRRFFHGYRPIPIDSELCVFADFWNRVAPQAVGDHPNQHPHDPSVRHAMVALGAAYQLFRHPDEPLPADFTRDSLEVFTIQQYNQSIARLQPHVRSSSLDSVRVTLLCCLAFIFLETLRANHDAAVTHFINGLKILQSLEPTSFGFFASTALLPTASGGTFTMADIIRLFGQLEVTACFFPNAIRPVVALHGYRGRLLDDGASISTSPPSDMASLHHLLTIFHRDVMAYLHETYHGEYRSVRTPLHQRQHAALLSRSSRLNTILASLPADTTAGAATTTISYRHHLTFLNFRTAQLLLITGGAAPPSSTPPPPPPPPLPIPPTAALGNAILHHAAILHASPISSLHCAHSPSQPTAAFASPLSAPLYLAAATSPQLQAQAVRLLAATLITPTRSSSSSSSSSSSLGTTTTAASSTSTISNKNREADNHHHNNRSIRTITRRLERIIAASRKHQQHGSSNQTWIWEPILLFSLPSSSSSSSEKVKGKGNSLETGTSSDNNNNNSIPRSLTGLGCMPGVFDALWRVEGGEGEGEGEDNDGDNTGVEEEGDHDDDDDDDGDDDGNEDEGDDDDEGEDAEGEGEDDEMDWS